MAAGTLREIFRRYGRPYLKVIAAMVALTVVTNTFVITQSLVLAAILAAVLGGTSSAPTAETSALDLNQAGDFVVKWIQGFAGTDHILLVLSATFIGLAALGFFLDYACLLLALRIRTSAGARVQDDLVRHLLALDLRFFHRKRAGELLSRLNVDALNTGVGLGPLIFVFMRDGLLLLAYGVLLLNTSPLLAVIALAFVAVQFGLTQALKKPVRRTSRTANDKRAELTARFQETLTNVRVVKSFGVEEYEGARVHAAIGDAADIDYRRGKIERFEAPARNFLSAVVIVALFGVGTMEVSAGRLTLTGLVMFLYVGRLIPAPASGLAQSYLWTQSLLAAYEPISGLLEEKPKVVDGDVVKGSFDQTIELRGVCFHYDPNIPALADVNLVLRKGEVTALVGPSGAGKSTIADLVLRMYDPESGQVLMDGVDLRNLRQKNYRRLFGVVSQESLLFHASIRENIRFGRAELTDQDVERAARMAHADDFIARLPQGYETLAGDRGVKLSGGERQRIAIARAVAHRPQVLVLDEATSQLDSESERQVQRAIDDLTKGSTALVIAHRLSTVRKADKIVVLDKGRLVGMGRHDELILRCPLYERLCAHQFGPAGAVPGARVAVVAAANPIVPAPDR